MGHYLTNLHPYQYLARPTSMLCVHFVPTQLSAVMTRCQIGHTLITHLCLQRRQEQPICQLCDMPLNVKQLLLHCNHLAIVYIWALIKVFTNNFNEAFDRSKILIPKSMQSVEKKNYWYTVCTECRRWITFSVLRCLNAHKTKSVISILLMNCCLLRSAVYYHA